MLKVISELKYSDGWVEVVVPSESETVQVQNVGNNSLILKLSSTKPSSYDLLGVRLYRLSDHISFTLSGGNKLWVRNYPSVASGNLIYSEDWLDFPTNVVEKDSNSSASIVQSYTESNVKNGVQYETSLYIEDFSDTFSTVVITGSKPVIVKYQYYYYNGLGILSNMYEAPIYTGGDVRTYFNKNKYTPVTGEVQILSDVTTSSLGTLISAQQAHLGSDGTGNRDISTAGNDELGLETVLAPNTEYLFQITSLDNSNQKLYVYSTWYEGDLD